jgi:serine/threonine-protein kinase RsbW
MACSASFAQMMGFSADRIEDLKTVVAEAAINAIQHGNKQHPDAKVTILMNFKDDTINVSVLDAGDGIKDIPPKPDIGRLIENRDTPEGFGLFLINQLADRVEYSEGADGGNVVNIAFRMK